MTGAAELTLLREITGHSDATVSEGVFRGDRVAVKAFNSEAGFSRECGALAAVGATGAPVPEVLWTGYHDDKPTIVQQWVDGTAGLRAFLKARGASRRSLVRLAATTHADMCRAAIEAPPPDPGFMAHVKGVSPDHHDWPRLLASQVEKWISRMSPATLDILGGDEAMKRLLAAAHAAPTELRTVVHCDYLFRNLIISSADSAVIIDFGAALLGDPRYDLAKIVWRDLDGLGGDLATHFVRSWIERSGIAVPTDLLSLYVACHSLAALAWVEKQALPSETDAVFKERALAAFVAVPKPWL